MTAPTMKILSLGVGVQSTTLALMACDGTLPGLDAAIFADTGWEPPTVYEQVDRLEAELRRCGIPLFRVSNGDLRSESIDPDVMKSVGRQPFAAIPYYILYRDGTSGQGQRQCTYQYKKRPVNRKTRELLGAKPPHFRRVARDRVAEQWIGFSTDEIGRVNDRRDVLYIVKRHPLLELNMSRDDCSEWLSAAGWGHTAKSACIGCPYHGNRQWRHLRDHQPELWADAVAFDRAIRNGGSRPLPPKATAAYVHPLCVPLDQAPIDRMSKAEYGELQGSLFDRKSLRLSIEVLENGRKGGCSPHGCESGEPVELDGEIAL